MKILITSLIILVIVSITNINYLSGSLNDLIPGELIIVNSSNAYIKATVYPIGMFFNRDLNYSIESKLYPTRKILGGSKDNMNFNSRFTLDHDAADGTNADSIIGFGKYRVVFLLYNIISHEYDSVDYCDVDYTDADYPYSFHDITFNYYSNDSITFAFNGGTTNNIQITERSLKIWDQYGGHVHKTQNKNGFNSDSIYINYPINTISYGAVDHINPGDIFINLQITDSINTRDTNPYNITVKKNAYLILEQGKILNMITPYYPSNGFTNLIVEDSAFLNLKPNSKIYVENRNRLTLK